METKQRLVASTHTYLKQLEKKNASLKLAAQKHDADFRRMQRSEQKYANRIQKLKARVSEVRETSVAQVKALSAYSKDTEQVKIQKIKQVYGDRIKTLKRTISKMRDDFVTLVAKDQETDIQKVQRLETMYGARIQKLKAMVDDIQANSALQENGVRKKSLSLKGQIAQEN